jgi:hypothetical protein
MATEPSIIMTPKRAMIQLSILGIVFGLVNGAIVGGGLIWTLRRSKFVFYID